MLVACRLAGLSALNRDLAHIGSKRNYSSFAIAQPQSNSPAPAPVATAAKG